MNAAAVAATGRGAVRAYRPEHCHGAARLMRFDPNLLPLAGFAVVMVAAAFVDFRRLVIPNELVAALCILWLLHVEGTRGAAPAAALAAIAGAALALIGGAILFARGLIGGGDVKLFAAAALWAGAGAVPRLLALTALIGGGLALLFLSPLGPRLIAVRRADRGGGRRRRAAGRPYADPLRCRDRRRGADRDDRALSRLRRDHARPHRLPVSDRIAARRRHRLPRALVAHPALDRRRRADAGPGAGTAKIDPRRERRDQPAGRSSSPATSPGGRGPTRRSPRDFIVAGAAPEKSFAGWVAREPFVAGEPIVKAKIVAPGDHGFLAAVLKPGMRAVSVAVDQTSDVSGFVFPGDRIDILINLSLPAESANGNGYQRKAAQTVLRDIRVIAIDQRLDSKDGQAVVARTVTLEVTPKQSEIVAARRRYGQAVAEPAQPRCDCHESEASPLPRLPTATARVSHLTRPPIRSTATVPPALRSTAKSARWCQSPFIFNHNYDDGKVTILRGNGGSGTSAGSQPGG